MSARGRGRGRGGRGGRGGPSLGPPGLRDDDGNLLQAQLNHGPPPLFPVSAFVCGGASVLCGGLCRPTVQLYRWLLHSCVWVFGAAPPPAAAGSHHPSCQAHTLNIPAAGRCTSYPATTCSPPPPPLLLLLPTCNNLQQVLELPHDPPRADDHDQLLLLRRSDLLKFYRASPYHIGGQLTAGKQATAAAAAEGGGGDLEDVERYADRWVGMRGRGCADMVDGWWCRWQQQGGRGHLGMCRGQ